MKKYEILDHKADLKIRVFGGTKEELFLNALLGTNEGLRPEIQNSESEKRKIKIKSPDLSALLVDFLNEILRLSQTNMETYDKTEFKELSDNEIEVDILGSKVEKFGEEIKAATYHDLSVSRNKDGIWETIILFDI